VLSGDAITFIAGEREYGFTLQVLPSTDEGDVSFSKIYEMDSKVYSLDCVNEQRMIGKKSSHFNLRMPRSWVF
jgi:hypothetical protein